MLPSDTVGGITTDLQNSYRWITLGGKMVISLTRKVICPLRVMVPLEDNLKTGNNLPLQGEKNTNKHTKPKMGAMGTALIPTTTHTKNRAAVFFFLKFLLLGTTANTNNKRGLLESTSPRFCTILIFPKGQSIGRKKLWNFISMISDEESLLTIE